MRFLGRAGSYVLYEVTTAEYLAADKKDHIGYVISDKDNYVVNKGKVVGQHLKDRMRPMTGVELFPQPKVVTERPTIEKLAKEGEDKLNEVVKESSELVRAKRKPRTVKVNTDMNMNM